MIGNRRFAGAAMASKPLTERFQTRIDDIAPGRRHSTRQHSPGGKES